MRVSRQGFALLNHRQIVLPDLSIRWGHDKSLQSMVTQLRKGIQRGCALICFSKGDQAFCFIDLFPPLLFPAILRFVFMQEVPFQIRELEWVFSHL